MTRKVNLMASDETAPKAKHHITLTRAALYLLEGCLQLNGPQANSYPRIVQWNKVWDKVRKANNRKIATSWAPEGHDFEKPLFRREGETDLDFTKRDAEWKEAVRAWENTTVTVAMNDKMRDTCRETVEWIHSHRDDAKVGIKIIGPHAVSLLIGLGLCKPEDDSDYEIEDVAPLTMMAAAK